VCEVQSAVADQELDALEPLVEGEGQVAGLLHRPLAGGFAVTPPRCIRRVPCSMNTRTCSLLNSTESTCRKADGQDPGGLGVQELPPGRARAARAGSTPVARRISRTVDGATLTPVS
jgi:hypothetical protein